MSNQSEDRETAVPTGDGIPARTIRSRDGRVLVFSCDQFVQDICQGDCCFICGAAAGTKPFNGEHVFPRWLLKRFNLFRRTLTLPGGQTRSYGQYKLPCCVECNRLLGKKVETPVSRLLAGGYDTVIPRLLAGDIGLLFVWLTLLFLKVHLKDRSVPRHPNPNLNDGRLADAYHWPDMHHLHCVARVAYTRAEVLPAVIGSIQLFKVEDELSLEGFDYGDFSQQQTLCLRIANLGIAAVLNDSGAATLAWEEVWPRIVGPVSTLQLREIAALLATANDDLLNRPIFGSAYSPGPDAVTLYAQHAALPQFAPYDRRKFGDLLFLALRDRLNNIAADGVIDPDVVEARLRDGTLTFLLNTDGTFRPTEIIKPSP